MEFDIYLYNGIDFVRRYISFIEFFKKLLFSFSTQLVLHRCAAAVDNHGPVRALRGSPEPCAFGFLVEEERFEAGVVRTQRKRHRHPPRHQSFQRLYALAVPQESRPVLQSLRQPHGNGRGEFFFYFKLNYYYYGIVLTAVSMLGSIIYIVHRKAVDCDR